MSSTASHAHRRIITETVHDTVADPPVPAAPAAAKPIADAAVERVAPLVLPATNNEPWYQSRVTRAPSSRRPCPFPTRSASPPTGPMIVLRGCKGVAEHIAIRRSKWIMLIPTFGMWAAFQIAPDMFCASQSFAKMAGWADKRT